MCVCVCVCDLYKCIFVAIYELCKALRATKRQGVVQILVMMIIIIEAEMIDDDDDEINQRGKVCVSSFVCEYFFPLVRRNSRFNTFCPATVFLSFALQKKKKKKRETIY